MNLAENDYPLPDPTWEYSKVYLQAIALHKAATEMIADMSEQERGSAEADETIRVALREISVRVKEITGLLNSE